jgi:acetolactate synthase-1/2/3 large subunit
MFYEERYSSTTLGRKTDFVQLAKAFGADGKTIHSMDELKQAFSQGFPSDGPFLLDCRIDGNERVYPMIPPGGSVKDMMMQQGGEAHE